MSKVSSLQMIYESLPQALTKIDNRKTNYQFDAEKDICWDQISSSGLYMPIDLLEDMGINTKILNNHPNVMEIFQWAFALNICESEFLIEQGLIDFISKNEVPIGKFKSNILLCTEEVKHQAVFKRFAAFLRQQKPKLVQLFDEEFLKAPGFFENRHLMSLMNYQDNRDHHFMFWYGALFFEEFSGYLHARFQKSKESLQPAWVSLHAQHWKEEAQHVLTDYHHLKAMSMPKVEQLKLSKKILYGTSPQV